MDFHAFFLSLRLAAATTAILLVISTPLAVWLADGRSTGRNVVKAAVALPLVIPPTVLGFYVLVGLGPLTPVGRILTRLLGHTLAFSFSGLVVASVLYSLPFAVQPLVVGFESVPRDVRETARVLGASRLQTAMRIVVPLARTGFVTAAVLTFAHTLGEFGVVLMVGGDIPGITRTVSIAIFDRVQEAQYGAANAMSLLLIGVSFVALLVVYSQGRTVQSPSADVGGLRG
jgi:molybdate transport system permease protein